MPTFSFTEKEWDKVRPSSVKKTGVSEAMRDVLKGVPKDLKALADAKACEAATKLLEELDKAFEGAEGLVKKAKDDKHDAAGKLKTWRAEVKDGQRMMELQKEKLIYAAANKAAVEKYQGIVDNIEQTVVTATKMLSEVKKDLQAGKEVDLDNCTKEMQNFRNVLRDAKDAVTKKGFIKLVKFVNDFHLTGLDPAKIEIPDSVKKIEAKLDGLETAVDGLGEAVAEAVEKQSTVKGDGELANEMRQLLDEYKESNKKIKLLAGKGKQLLEQTKKAAAVVKGSNVVETNKLLQVVSKMHETAQAYEDAVLKEGYRSRNTDKGELHVKYKALAKKPGFGDEQNKVFRDWRAAVFDTIRLCTMPTSAIKKEIDDAVDYLIEVGGTTASQADMLAKQIDKERRELAGKYGAAVA
ncbi:MAG: hypothetical protein SFU86_22935 [Pirellulaceae bacterium]|nr:hypothetical protein [Pirellulaceae bacterium]